MSLSLSIAVILSLLSLCLPLSISLSLSTFISHTHIFPPQQLSPEDAKAVEELDQLTNTLERDLNQRVNDQLVSLERIKEVKRERERLFEILVHLEGACDLYPANPLTDAVRGVLFETKPPFQVRGEENKIGEGRASVAEILKEIANTEY